MRDEPVPVKNDGPDRAETDRHADLPEGHWRDPFGVLWDRTEDKDIGVVSNCLLPEPNLKNYAFPDPSVKAEDPIVLHLTAL